MSYIDCEVNTQPMADEIGKVSQHIRKTTAAVVGMQMAVVKAENDAADSVCRNVNKGFYTLIRSQISQKIAKLQSEVDSHLMKLNQLRKQILFIQGRMTRDYNGISSRYSKLFNTLNKNLEQRVYELDKPTIEFAQKEVSAISNRSKNLPGTVPVGQLESLEISQKILASNIKYRGMKVIDSMTKFLSDVNGQKSLTQKILLPIPATNNASDIHVPVIVWESNYDEHENYSTAIVLNTTELTQRTREAIKYSINSGNTSFNWQPVTGIHKEIQNEFNKLNARSSSSQRVKDMTYKLFIANNFKTIKKS